MKEEMKALEKNSTWEIVDRPKDKRVVGCRWIYTVKCKSDGTLERYKARLVAKGYTQTHGIEYEETFAPMAKMNTNLQQFDVKNAFFHGDLEEEVYMEIPSGFYSHNEKNKSPRAWFERFVQAMISLGNRQSQGDHTLFIKHSPHGRITLLLVYVDDMIVIGDDGIEKLTLKEKLATQFEMKELGKLKYFLGIEVAYSKQGIFISQRKYVVDLLKETGKLGCKTSLSKTIGCEESSTIEKSQYHILVEKLIYLSHTRPDIAYVVSVVSQFMHNLRERHLQAVERILQYLKASPGKGFLFRKEGGNLVTWRSKKQNVVARFSAEAEFRVMTHGICEGLWMKIILDDLKVKNDGPIKLFCDNNSTISIVHNLVQHNRTKYIEIYKHFINEKLNSGLVVTTHIPTRFQITYIFTKGLPAARFQEFNGKLEMIDIHLPTQGRVLEIL
ncbi:Copia protein, partial [Mucuna pruriens]